jgi:hypothetical protein
MDELFEDPISSSIQEFLDVFKKDLGSVVFADVSLEGLESLAQKVRADSRELQDILKRVEVAREKLETEKNELLAKAGRGLAYAKIFAEGNDELLDKLSRINLGKPSRGNGLNPAPAVKPGKFAPRYATVIESRSRHGDSGVSL